MNNNKAIEGSVPVKTTTTTGPRHLLQCIRTADEIRNMIDRPKETT